MRAQVEHRLRQRLIGATEGNPVAIVLERCGQRLNRVAPVEFRAGVGGRTRAPVDLIL
jgi:hypothetical protein